MSQSSTPSSNPIPPQQRTHRQDLLIPYPDGNSDGGGLNNVFLTKNTSTTSDEFINLMIRFSTSSLPDLPISIPFSPSSTTATLKQRIRTSLPSDLQSNRLRLIHAGKALDDAVPLTTSLKRFVPRTQIIQAYDSPSGSENDAAQIQARIRRKGKMPIRDPPSNGRERVYIHCSIGDVVLPEEELVREETLANPTTSGQIGNDINGDLQLQSQLQSQTQTASGTAVVFPAVSAPRGFDRLLSAGFTASEVHSLRLQFISVQAHTHTPETMPSPNTLRELEDQWLDNSNASGSGGGLTGLGADGQGGMGGFDGSAAGDDGNGRGALDDMIWGTTMGFFWPIGCVIWGTRETGIFSPRRKIAVVIGLVMNLGLGFIKWGG